MNQIASPFAKATTKDKRLESYGADSLTSLTENAASGILTKLESTMAGKSNHNPVQEA